ncbi:MAG: hypothetical protein C5B51_16580 [Terriglobia bacterium]|nr:MAG: hypothetical protein C5B51_16580 [Terriglobia bacterium]
MAVLRPRNRLVYFRVSEDEFQQFHQVCEAARARSVSDLARYAVQRMINDRNGSPNPEDMMEKLKAVEAGICDLSMKLQELTVLVKGARVNGAASVEASTEFGDNEVGCRDSRID